MIATTVVFDNLLFFHLTKRSSIIEKNFVDNVKVTHK